jgi:threonine dehydrogenase-like Zn-dependent dehydrogenase
MKMRAVLTADLRSGCTQICILVVRGNLVCSMTQYYQAVGFLKAHPAIRLDDMITHRFRITEAAEAFAVLNSRKTGKVMFEWE